MPITGDSLDYTGRTVDILVFGGVDGLTRGFQPVSLTFGKPSQYVTGVQKLAQRYGINMLTILGSQPNYPAYGTNFLSSLQSTSRQITQTAATHIFNFANIKTLSEFRLYQSANPGLPLDEQINSATLLSFSVSGGTINFTVSLTTKAGTNAVFVVPLPKK
jgi:hypothetical protein